jgi:hypothetical protein
MQNKHILILVYFNSPMGGLHLNILDSVKFLVQQNIKVTVVAKAGIFLEHILEVGASIIKIDFDFLIEYNVNYIVSRLIDKPTIIHTHQFKSKDIAIHLSDFYKVPLIMTLHSINDRYIKSYESKIDLFLSVSNLVRDFIIAQDIQPNKVFTLHNGIYLNNTLTNEKKSIFNNSYKTILTVSRFNRDKSYINKSIKFVLEKILEEQFFTFNWVFVGTGEDIEILEKIAEKINIASNREIIKFLGWKTPKEIDILSQNADFFIGPGRCVIEALKYGLVSIALGSKGYVGLVDDRLYLDAIYSNFGGDSTKQDISLLYQDFYDLFQLDNYEISHIKSLSKSIVKQFFNLENLNNDLINIYDTLSTIYPPNKLQERNINLLNNLSQFNKSNYFIKGEVEFDNFNIKPVQTNEVIYIIAGNKTVNGLPPINYKVLLPLKLNISLDIQYEDTLINLFIIEFNESEKIKAKSYELKNGFNLVNHSTSKKTKFMKIAFRINFLKKDSHLNLNTINFSDTSQKVFIPSIKNIDHSYRLLFGEYTYSFVDKYYETNMYINYKKNKKIIVSFNGAINREKRLYNFQRYSWSDELDYSFVSIIDPTITKQNDLNIGWYQGHKNQFAIDKISEYLKNIFIENNIDEKDVIFFGSSAGGFGVLKMAEIFIKSKIIVINPQIYISKYYKSAVLKMYNTVFQIEDIDNISKLYENRFKIDIDFSKREESIYYIQNKEDIHHYNEHLLTYLETINIGYYRESNLTNPNYNNSLNIIYYEDDESGHKPPNKEKTINILNNIINN